MLPYKDEWELTIAAIPLAYGFWKVFIGPIYKARTERLKKQEQLYITVNDIKIKLETLDQIVADLRPNSGTSLRDAIDRVERLVLTNNQTQKGFLDLMAVGFWISDPEGQVTYANRHLLKLTGLAIDEIMGTGGIAAVYPDERERVLDEWMTAVKEGRAFHMTYRIKNVITGQVTPVVAHSVALHDPAGKIYGYIGTLVEEKPLVSSFLDSVDLYEIDKH